MTEDGEWRSRWSQQRRWDYYLPPGRPSDSHLGVFRSRITNELEPRSQVAVLGSTPELCDLVVETGHVLTIVDNSQDFFNSVQQLRVYPNAGTLDCRDWVLALNSHRPAAFDMILADLVLGNMPYDQRPHLLRAIGRTLRDGGAYVEKLFLCDKSQSLTPDAIARMFMPRALNIATINDFANIAFFRSSLTMGDIIVPRELCETYESIWSNCPRMLALLQSAMRLFPPSARWYYGRSRSAVLTDYNRASLRPDATWSDEPYNSPFHGCLEIVSWKKAER